MPLMKVYDKTTGQWLVMDSKNADTVDGKHYSDIQSEITTKANTAESNAKNASIPKTEKGKANGVAKLNASGKVVDASGNEVEGKVKSVNGVQPDTSGNITIETFDGNYNNLTNKPNLTQYATVEQLNAKTPVLKGKSNFNSTTGKIISHSIGHTNYYVEVTPSQNPNGYLGEVWVEYSSTSFKVCCSGTATTEFRYVVYV